MPENPIDNPYSAPTDEDDIRQLVAKNPGAHYRASVLGLALWIGWLMLVIVGIVWLVG